MITVNFGHCDIPKLKFLKFLLFCTYFYAPRFLFKIAKEIKLNVLNICFFLFYLMLLKISS